MTKRNDTRSDHQAFRDAVARDPILKECFNLNKHPVPTPGDPDLSLQELVSLYRVSPQPAVLVNDPHSGYGVIVVTGFENSLAAQKWESLYYEVEPSGMVTVVENYAGSVRVVNPIPSTTLGWRGDAEPVWSLVIQHNTGALTLYGPFPNNDFMQGYFVHYDQSGGDRDVVIPVDVGDVAMNAFRRFDGFPEISFDDFEAEIWRRNDGVSYPAHNNPNWLNAVINKFGVRSLVS